MESKSQESGAFVESQEFRIEHFIPVNGQSLRPHDAAAALLIREDGSYIMQLRDGMAGIFYPGHWGCFGGAVEPGETPVDALKRELREEIEFEMPEATRFTQFDFDFSPLGYPKVYRTYFEVLVPDMAFRRLILHEGADVQAFRGENLLTTRRVTPYDAFAVWMHLNRQRLLSARNGHASGFLCP
jgi:8-oxo-dGTP pyrophosphatase MutT (NUDIX family)